MAARDAGAPESLPASNRAQVRVDVLRNSHSPLFFNQSYFADIRQDAGVGNQIVVVQATDADEAVTSAPKTSFLPFEYLKLLPRLFFLQNDFKTIRYSIVGDDSAPDFFEVNAESGQVRLSASIANELTELYRV